MVLAQLFIQITFVLLEAAAAVGLQVLQLALQIVLFDQLIDAQKPRFDQLQLVVIELLGFDQHLLAHADLAEVVQQRSVANLPDLFAGETHRRKLAVAQTIDGHSQAGGELGDAEAVTRGRWIALFDRCHRRGDEALKEVADVLNQDVVQNGHGGLTGKGLDQLDASIVEGDDQIAAQFFDRQRSGDVLSFAVDQLDDADRISMVILHRNHHHRARSIVVRAVELVVEEKTLFAAQFVNVFDDQRLAAQGHKTGDRIGIDRQQELIGIQDQGRLFEAQMGGPLSGFAPFDHVDRTAVGADQLAGVMQNQIDQTIEVALR